MSLILKDPGAALDYEIDWGADYLVEGDTLLESGWTVFPEMTDGVRVESAAFSPTVARVSVRGGAQGRVYRLTNRVTTINGRSDARSIMLRVEMR